MILFRADGNKQIGSGHIMRCLSIASKAKEMGMECAFCVSDGAFLAHIEKSGFSCYVLETAYDDMNAELPKVETLISALKPEIIIVDSYYVTNAYLSALKEMTTLVYIDDLMRFAYPVDVLINYNIYAQVSAYEKLYEATRRYPKYVLGSRFAPLRQEFINLPQREDVGEIKDIFISTGGADQEHIALKMAQYIRKYNVTDKVFHFVVGAMNGDFEELKNLSKTNKNIVLHSGITQMSELMMGCDMAISASGSTLYELCACGIPTICYSLADNQIFGNVAFAKSGAMVSAGDVRKEKNFIENLFSIIERVGNDQALRKKMQQKMRAVTDGNGAYYIIKEITNQKEQNNELIYE